MVHASAALGGRRARHRAERTATFLAAARTLVFTQGLGALTMQRLAAEVGCAVGTAYTYFPSKSALVAELQRVSIETLRTSAERFVARFDGTVGRTERDATTLALARLVGFGRFWVDTFDSFPEEARLLQVLLSETSPTVDDRDVQRVLPAALALLDLTRTAADDAAAIGAISPGDAMERTVVLAAALNGMLLLGHVARVDPALFDGPRLAGSVVRDLLLGWGAEASALSAAQRRIDALARKESLAR